MGKELETDNRAACKIEDTAEYVIELSGVTKDYGDFKLDHVSFQIPKGCICGFIGQNGAGKTTTINSILNIIGVDEGKISVLGQDMKVQGESIKQRIGVVFDEMGYHEFLTAKQIGTIMKNVYADWDDELYNSYLKRFALPQKKRCGAFSRGMRMKLQIAVALSHHAQLLIMDEPTSGLDPIVRNEILDIFQEFVLDEDHTILLSSHITSDLERIADMVVFINAGRIVLSGDKYEILESHAILRCKKSDLSLIDKEDLVFVRHTSLNVEALVRDAQNCRGKYPDLTFEQSTLEEIMLFYVSRSQAENA